MVSWHAIFVVLIRLVKTELWWARSDRSTNIPFAFGTNWVLIKQANKHKDTATYILDIDF